MPLQFNRSRFLAIFVRSQLERIWFAFQAKARGQPDDLGNTWKPHASSTTASKRRKEQRGTKVLRALSAKQQKRFQTTFDQLFRQAQSVLPPREARVKAIALAYRSVTKNTGPQGQYLINIDTQRLSKSLRPGTATDSGYLPPNPDQTVIISGNDERSVATIGTQVPYADKVHAVRPLWPPADQQTPWSRDSIREAAEGSFPGSVTVK